jgi:hypothetical protein
MAYWVAFDIACLKQDPTKGLTNFKEKHNTTEAIIVASNARSIRAFASIDICNNLVQ